MCFQPRTRAQGLDFLGYLSHLEEIQVIILLRIISANSTKRLLNRYVLHPSSKEDFVGTNRTPSPKGRGFLVQRIVLKT